MCTFIQHCSVCRPSDSTVSEDAGIDCCYILRHWPSDALYYSARSHPLYIVQVHMYILMAQIVAEQYKIYEMYRTYYYKHKSISPHPKPKIHTYMGRNPES